MLSCCFVSTTGGEDEAKIQDGMLGFPGTWCINFDYIQMYANEIYSDIIRNIHEIVSRKAKYLNFGGSTAWVVRRTVAMSRCYGSVHGGD